VLCPRPLWGAYSAPPDHQLNFRGLVLRGRMGEEERGRHKEER